MKSMEDKLLAILQTQVDQVKTRWPDFNFTLVVDVRLEEIELWNTWVDGIAKKYALSFRQSESAAMAAIILLHTAASQPG
jgi:hypothetical protein